MPEVNIKAQNDYSARGRPAAAEVFLRDAALSPARGYDARPGKSGPNGPLWHADCYTQTSGRYNEVPEAVGEGLTDSYLECFLLNRSAIMKKITTLAVVSTVLLAASAAQGGIAGQHTAVRFVRTRCCTNIIEVNHTRRLHLKPFFYYFHLLLVCN